jgi:NTP pyrophosphatase (non-canonical NTP hydrolase)
MELNTLIELQAEFDRRHAGAASFYVPISKENVQDLEHLVVCMLGELGEFANVVKKVVRGDFDYDTSRPILEEELADVFIYLMKIAGQSGIDLESAFLRKLEKNEGRFSHLMVP